MPACLDRAKTGLGVFVAVFGVPGSDGAGAPSDGFVWGVFEQKLEVGCGWFLGSEVCLNQQAVLDGAVTGSASQPDPSLLVCSMKGREVRGLLGAFRSPWPVSLRGFRSEVCVRCGVRCVWMCFYGLFLLVLYLCLGVRRRLLLCGTEGSESLFFAELTRLYLAL
jgi:hypothetical protein